MEGLWDLLAVFYKSAKGEQLVHLVYRDVDNPCKALHSVCTDREFADTAPEILKAGYVSQSMAIRNFIIERRYADIMLSEIQCPISFLHL